MTEGNEDPRSTSYQTAVVYPPSTSIRFTTISKRFPYDKGSRATTSEQELRKRILRADSVNDIKNAFFITNSSSSTSSTV